MPSSLGIGIQICGIVWILGTGVLCGLVMFLDAHGEEYINEHRGDQSQGQVTKKLQQLDQLRKIIRSADDEYFETIPRKLIWIYLVIGLGIGTTLIIVGRM